MSCLNNLFNDIINDFSKEQYKNQIILSRRFVLDNDIVLIAYFNNYQKKKELSIKISNNFNRDVVAKYPDWKGISVRISEITNGDDKGLYLSFPQLENSDENIYDAILEDVIENLKETNGFEQVINTVGKVLVKWKQFFKTHNQLVMTDIRQQGLYAELVFLKKMISENGDKALNYWSGCNFETHDFYIKGNAIEVKSTSSNDGNSVIISNEFQLDINDVSERLYLMFIFLRKSLSDGQTLPSIVEEIINMLDESSAIEMLEQKLFKYGYLIRRPELYIYGFIIRDVRYYEIGSEFPSIIKCNLHNAVSNVSYKLNLNKCDKFSVSEECIIEKLKGA